MRPARREVAELRAKLDAVDLAYPPAPAVLPTSHVSQEHQKLKAVDLAYPPTRTAEPGKEGGARAGAGAVVTVTARATAMEDGPPAKGDAMSDPPAPASRHDAASDSLAQIHDTLHRFSRLVAAEGGRANPSLAPSEHHHADLRRRPSRVAAEGGRADLGVDSAKAKGPDATEGGRFGARWARGRSEMTRPTGESNKRGHDVPYQASAHASAKKEKQTGDGAAYGLNWLESLFGASSTGPNTDSDADKEAHRAALHRAGIWFFSPSMHTCTRVCARTRVRSRARAHTHTHKAHTKHTTLHVDEFDDNTRR